MPNYEVRERSTGDIVFKTYQTQEVVNTGDYLQSPKSKPGGGANTRTKPYKVVAKAHWHGAGIVAVLFVEDADDIAGIWNP